MFKRGLIYRLLEGANDGTTGSTAGSSAGAAGAGGNAAAATAVANAGGAGSVAGTQGGGEPSLLSQGAGGQGGAAGQPGGAAAVAGAPASRDWLNEKFHVKNDKGELDIEGSAKKIAESYTQLEKRVGAIGLPPESADGYEFKPPQGIPLDAERTKAFKEKALGLGLTQKQYSAVMTDYINELGNMPALMNAYMASKAKEAKPIMAKAWGGEANLQPNLDLASATFGQVFDNAPDEVKQNAEFLANSPAFLFLLAQYGRESQEDQSMLIGQGLMPENEIEGLMSDPKSAYWDPANPGHKAAVAKVTKHHEAQAALHKQR